MEFSDAIKPLLELRPLDESQADALVEKILRGKLDDARIASILSLIQVRGARVEELVGAARAMRRHVTRLDPGPGAAVVDTCGTGGAPKAFNVSTAAALVAAAASPGAIRVAKHGNRSRTGRGSAEVLAGLGVNVDAGPEVQARCLREVGVCFCFAIHHHPAMRHAAAARRALGFPTIFNLLGPLTNPAGASRQVLGVYDASLVPLLAEALRRLGAERAIVAHGLDGMDELSITGPTLIAHVEPRGVRTEVLNPQCLGIAPARAHELVARDLTHAVEIIRGVLDGTHGPPRRIVELNAAATLLVAGAAGSYAEGIKKSSVAIDSGAARETLARLVAVSRG